MWYDVVSQKAWSQGGIILALCEKYRRELSLESAVCPDPHIYCDFRTACLVYTVYEEGLESEEKDKEV